MAAGVADALPCTQGALRRAAASQLQNSDSPALDVDLILCHVLASTRVDLLAHPQRALTPGELHAFETLLARRGRGEPIAYLLGHKEFFGLDLAVDARVLVPRPDTETLVEAVLDTFPDTPMNVADLGTGSGAIAIALAAQRSHWQIVASDRSADALSVARANACSLEIGNIEFTLGDWCAPFAKASLDAIVSNPPYIAQGDTVDAELAFEPQHALYAGNDGLDSIRIIVATAPRVLRDKGYLFIEHGDTQGHAVRALFDASGFVAVRTRVDLSGRERVTCGRLPE